jgi:carbon-monoxide dehydrogenase iron sulfur subunit
MFCPYGVIVPWPQRKIALKCDRCMYMEFPVCVEVCPTQALELVNLDELEGIAQEKRLDTIEAIGGIGEGERMLLLGVDK